MPWVQTVPSQLSVHKPRVPSSPPSVVESLESDYISAAGTEYFQQCSFCEMPLDVTLTNESLMKLNCGHTVHCHCYHQLKMTSTKKRPHCGTCGMLCHPETVEDFMYEPEDDVEFAPPFDIKDGLAEPDFAEPYSASSLFNSKNSKQQLQSPLVTEVVCAPLSSGRCEEIIKDATTQPWDEDIENLEENQAINFNELGTVEIAVDIPGNESSPLNAAFATKHDKLHSPIQWPQRSIISEIRRRPDINAKYVCCGNQEVALRVALLPETGQIYKKTARTTVMLNVSIPDNVFSHYEYRMNADDFEYGLRIQNALRQLTFKGLLLKSLKPGRLRIHDRLMVSQDMGNTWQLEYWYLFSKYIVILRHQSDQRPVKAVLDVRHHISSVQQVQGKHHPTALKIHLSSVKIPDILIETADNFRLDCWWRAFEDSSAEFPLAPRLDNGIGRALRCRTKVIMCLPSILSDKQIDEFLSASKLNLQPCDKMGIIFYNPDSSVKCYSLPVQRDKITWRSTPEPDDVVFFSEYRPGSLLRVASSMLDDTWRRETVTSIIILNCQQNMNIDAIPEAILSSRVPIHTVGVTKNHDAIKLSTLSRQTTASYSYCLTFEEAGKALESLIVEEGRYTHNNVSVKIIPRIGVKLLGLHGARASPDLNTLLPDTILCPRQSSLLPQDDNTWIIGNMREGDSKSILLDIEISSLAGLPSGTCDLIAAKITATNAGENNRQEVTSRLPVQFSAEIQEDEDYLVSARKTGIRGTRILEEVFTKCHQRSYCDAVGILCKEVTEISRMIERVEVSQNRLSSLLAAIKRLYEEGIISLQEENNSQHFMLSALYHAWVFASEHVHVSRGPIAAAYFEPRTSGVALIQ